MRKISKNKTEDDSKSTDEAKNSVDEKNDSLSVSDKIDDAHSTHSENAENGKPSKASQKRKSKNKSVTINDSKESEEAETSYEVESIVDSKKIRGKLHFLIKWKGYSAAENSWEPEDIVESPELIEKFNKEKQSQPKKAKKRGASKKSKSETTPKKTKKLKDDFDYENANENEEYEVEKILEVHHKMNGKREFLIHWKGWATKHDTWEPEENLNCKDMIKKFMAKVEEKKSVSEKDLRIARKPTDRFTLSQKSGGRRLSKRGGNKQRVRYDDAE